jgi:hypothetical protein
MPLTPKSSGRESKGDELVDVDRQPVAILRLVAQAHAGRLRDRPIEPLWTVAEEPDGSRLRLHWREEADLQSANGSRRDLARG